MSVVLAFCIGYIIGRTRVIERIVLWLMKKTKRANRG
jgi:hypothetical protein